MAKPHHNWQHQQVRARIAPYVTALTPCAYSDCGKALGVNVGGPAWPRWDLAHDDVRGGYLGPAHVRCNTRRWSESPRSRHRRARDGELRSITISSSGRLRRVAGAGSIQRRARS